MTHLRIPVEKTSKDYRKKSDNFIQKLRQMPSGYQGLIFGAKSIKTYRCWAKDTSKSDLSHIEKLLDRAKRNSPKVALKVESGYRNISEIEFWIVPPDNSDFYPERTMVDCFCPPYFVDMIEDIPKKGNISFFLIIPSHPSNKKLTFKWEVSTGKIIKGQGMMYIEVDINNVRAKEIKATVKIKGLPKSEVKACGNSISATAKTPTGKDN